MRSFLGYAATVLILSCCLIFITFLFTPSRSDNGEYTSPLPDFLNISVNKQVKLLDFWVPFIEKIQGSERGVPLYTAKAALMYDLTTNKTLFEDHAQERMPMASLTKIMTAIIALENKKSDNRYTVFPENIVGEDSMGLTEGEVLTQEELLYGLMLPSGNDAAEVLASNYKDGRNAFIEAMNDKAKALGLTDTQFSNPSGLQGDGIQHTTAADLLVMTKYALEKFPLLAKIVATYEYTIPATQSHKAYTLYNETNLLTTYPGVKGVKTGYTPEAGMCLVTLLEYKGHKIVGILLNSQNRREEMKHFLDFSLQELSIEPPIHQ